MDAETKRTSMYSQRPAKYTKGIQMRLRDLKKLKIIIAPLK